MSTALAESAIAPEAIAPESVQPESVQPEAVNPIEPKRGEAPEPQRFCTLPNGLEIGCQSAKETEHIYDDIFAHRVYLSGGITLWDGATVFDIGGNIGMFTVFLHQTYRNIKSYTFEPAPPLFDILHYNTAQHAGGGTCKLFNCGVSDTYKVANLTFYPYSSGMSSFYGDQEEEKDVLRIILANQEEAGDNEADGLATSEEFLDARFTEVNFECPLVPLEQIIRQEGVETIDLMKIDVQKSELDVLRGLGEDDWGKVRQIAMEVHDLDGELAIVQDLLAKHDFNVVVEQDPLYIGSVMYNLFAVRKNLYQELAGGAPKSAAKAPRTQQQKRGKKAFARFRKQKKG